MNRLEILKEVYGECEWSESALMRLMKVIELTVRECDRYVAERFDECEPWMNPGDLLEHFGVE